MWRRILRAVRALTYLGLMGVLFAVVSYAAFNHFVRRGVTSTPDLTAKSEDEALALLVDHGLTMVRSDDEARYDESIPAGHVAAQKPRGGTLVKRGNVVTVVISRGPQRVAVPAVTGEALQAAQVTLAHAGLTVGRTVSVFSDEGRDGIVVAQRPAAAARAEPGQPIDLFLSMKSTRHTFLMPDLVRRDYDEVRRFFERRGFRLGRVGYLTYDGVAPGTVVRQYPVAGHPLRQGDVIALGVVSPEPTETEVMSTESNATDLSSPAPEHPAP